MHQGSIEQPNFFSKQCSYCEGRLESKGIRYLRRRYRCTKYKKNAASVALTEFEIESLRSKDKQIGGLGLEERRQEIEKLRNKKSPYCLLPTYDPKFVTEEKTSNHEEIISQKYSLAKKETKKVTNKLGSIYNE